MASSDRVPADHYGDALIYFVARGVADPETAAALVAHVAETLEDLSRKYVSARTCAATIARIEAETRAALSFFPEWWE